MPTTILCRQNRTDCDHRRNQTHKHLPAGGRPPADAPRHRHDRCSFWCSPTWHWQPMLTPAPLPLLMKNHEKSTTEYPHTSSCTPIPAHNVCQICVSALTASSPSNHHNRTRPLALISSNHPISISDHDDDRPYDAQAQCLHISSTATNSLLIRLHLHAVIHCEYQGTRAWCQQMLSTSMYPLHLLLVTTDFVIKN